MKSKKPKEPKKQPSEEEDNYYDDYDFYEDTLKKEMKYNSHVVLEIKETNGIVKYYESEVEKNGKI